MPVHLDFKRLLTLGEVNCGTYQRSIVLESVKDIGGASGFKCLDKTHPKIANLNRTVNNS